MDRIWGWGWERYGSRYSWVVVAISSASVLPIFALTAAIVVAFERSDRYLGGIGVAVTAGLIALIGSLLPGDRAWRKIERWAAGDPVDPLEALRATYEVTRRGVPLSLAWFAVMGAISMALVGALAGATGGRVVQYSVIGLCCLLAVDLVAFHAFPDSFLRPPRLAIGGDTGIGDELPSPTPTFATWSTILLVATAWVFTMAGAAFGSVIESTRDVPVLIVVIATGFGVVFAVPVTAVSAFAPSLRPIRDLTEGTKRVVAGDYSQRLPVVQDDDLGALAASFNRMQAGLAERERLRAAFGSYVDPALAARLLDQPDDVFAGERREVTVLFVDVRDFTPFAEANTAEDAVAHLNALFDIVVPAVLEAGGHVNKYLGDGAMAVFGAPVAIEHHADAAVAVAREVQRRVEERFDGALRVGIGINTGSVIAGTIGGGGKLEFTLIGDAVNVAARVEQLTKETGDGILLTQSTLDALEDVPADLVDRGAHALKGKALQVRVHAVATTGIA